MPRRGYKFTAEERARITAARLATTRANRAARLASMTPAERLAELAANQRKRSVASRDGWRTRRANLGQPPDRRAPPTRPVQVYVADLEAARRLHPDAKRGVHAALQGLRLAVEAGALVWTGSGWRLT